MSPLENVKEVTRNLMIRYVDFQENRYDYKTVLSLSHLCCPLETFRISREYRIYR